MGDVGEGAHMPRELARQSVRQEAAGSHPEILEVEVRQTDRTVRVTLSGILDREGSQKVIGRVAPRLMGRGCRVVLDGSQLSHLDYRATAALCSWNRKLRQFRHELFLQGWSDYLKAILLMDDWDGELSDRPASHRNPAAPCRSTRLIQCHDPSPACPGSQG